jgi:Nuclease-related domain
MGVDRVMGRVRAKIGSRGDAAASGQKQAAALPPEPAGHPEAPRAGTAGHAPVAGQASAAPGEVPPLAEPGRSAPPEPALPPEDRAVPDGQAPPEHTARPPDTAPPPDIAPAQDTARPESAEPPDRTMPLVPVVIPALPPVPPAAPVPGLGASEAGLAALSALAGLAVLGAPLGVTAPDAKTGRGTPGMTGILGQDQQAFSRRLAPLAGLARDPRHAWWIRRAVACTVLGTTLAILVGWPLGVLGAAVTAAADSLFRARTSPAVPPWVRAASAQRRTRRRLARLAPAGYLSLHARAIPGTGAVVDHLVVGPAGIYAVDSEVWDRRLPIRATRGGELFHGPNDQAARLKQARWEAGEVSRLLSNAIGQPVAVRPAMVIYGPTVPWIMIKIDGVDVFCGGRLRTYLRREAGANHAWRLDDRQAEAIHTLAAELLPPAR